MSRDETKDQTVPFEIRSGGSLVGPVFRGMRREGSAGNIPLNQFQHLQNARLAGGDVFCRGGQEQTGDVVPGLDCADGGSVPGIDVSPASNLLSFIVNAGGNDTDPGIDYVNEDLDPDVYGLALGAFVQQSNLPPLAASGYPRHVLVNHEGDPYFYGGSDYRLWRLSIPTDVDAPPTERAYTPVGFIGSGVLDMHSAFGEVWFSFTGGAVKSFDVETGALTDRGDTGLTDPIILCKHQETVYACGLQELKRWDGGTTWTSVSTLTDTTVFSPRCMFSASDDKLYIGGQEVGPVYPPSVTVDTHAWIYEFDASTGTATGTLVNGADQPSGGDFGGVVDITEYHDEIVFAWNPSAEDSTNEGFVQNLAGDYLRIFYDESVAANAVVARCMQIGDVLYVLAGFDPSGLLSQFSPSILKLDEGEDLSGAGTLFFRGDDGTNNGMTLIALTGFATPCDMAALL